MMWTQGRNYPFDRFSIHSEIQTSYFCHCVLQFVCLVFSNLVSYWSLTVGYQNSKWLGDSLLQHLCQALEGSILIFQRSYLILYEISSIYVLKEIKHIFCEINKHTDIEPLHLDFCPSHCELQCEWQSWKNDEISNVRSCNVLKPASRSFLLYNLWLRRLWQLIYQHFLNFVAHIVSHNKRLHLGSHSLHIPATFSATMWVEFCSHCEGQV